MRKQVNQGKNIDSNTTERPLPQRSRHHIGLNRASHGVAATYRKRRPKGARRTPEMLHPSQIPQRERNSNGTGLQWVPVANR